MNEPMKWKDKVLSIDTPIDTLIQAEAEIANKYNESWNKKESWRGEAEKYSNLRDKIKQLIMGKHQDMLDKYRQTASLKEADKDGEIFG